MNGELRMVKADFEAGEHGEEDPEGQRTASQSSGEQYCKSGPTRDGRDEGKVVEKEWKHCADGKEQKPCDDQIAEQP